MSTKTRVVIVGAKGRMGEALIRLAKQDPRLELAAAADKGDDLAGAIGACDAVIEFAHHGATPEVAKLVADLGKALVIGTTGHTDAERKAIAAAAEKIAVVFAPNFSIGVN